MFCIVCVLKLKLIMNVSKHKLPMLNVFRSLTGMLLLGLMVGAHAGDASDDWIDGSEALGATTVDGQPMLDQPGAGSMGVLPLNPSEGAGTSILSNRQYRIGPSDEIDVEVFQVPDLSGVEKVNARGYINMPLIGLVMVAGLTEEEAEKLIADKLKQEYLQDPQVNIDIKDYVSQQVTVLGSVKSPGVYPLKGPTTLLQVIALAGGPISIADVDSVLVFRSNDKGEVVGYVVNLGEIQTGAKKDPKVVGNDRIVVPKSGSRAMIKGVTDTLRGFIGFGTL